MKKFELYLGIAMIIAVTVLICMYMFIFSYTSERLMFVSFFSIVSYIIAYFYIDSYITRHEMHHYLKGYDDARKDITSQH